MPDDVPPRTPLPPRPAEPKEPIQVPPWRQCSFDHSIGEDRKSWATHTFEVKVDGKEVSGRMCGKHGAAAIDRNEKQMIKLGGKTPESRQLAHDIAERDPSHLKDRPDHIDSHAIKDPPGWELSLRTPEGPTPDRPLSGYEGRTF